MLLVYILTIHFIITKTIESAIKGVPEGTIGETPESDIAIIGDGSSTYIIAWRVCRGGRQ
jgi:hypothetical protein